MPRRKSSVANNVGAGLTTKQLKRKKPLNADLLTDINPLTENQIKLFDSYLDGKNLFAYGAAGTGKTFVVLYNALKEVLSEDSPYRKIYIVRSLVSTREIGF
jgi:predicted ribonuclease YlaK